MHIVTVTSLGQDVPTRNKQPPPREKKVKKIKKLNLYLSVPA